VWSEAVLSLKVHWLVESFPLKHKSRLTAIQSLMDWTMAVHHAAAGRRQPVKVVVRRSRCGVSSIRCWWSPIPFGTGSAAAHGVSFGM